MLRKKVDKEIKKALIESRRMIQELEKNDSNEAETRRRIERIFGKIMGYDVFKHLTRERAVKSTGEAEHVDFAIQLNENKDAKPEIMVEIKRVSIDLVPKHLKQIVSYAVNAGCEWIILTNSKEWRLYHISFGQPPITKLLYSWNIITDDIKILAERFWLISYKSVKKGNLDELWQKTNILHPKNILQAILSSDSMRVLRRELRKNSGVLLAPEDIVSGLRRSLNENALGELENISLSLLSSRQKSKKKSKGISIQDGQETVV